MKPGHPLEIAHRHPQAPQPSMSHTRLLQAVVQLMAGWGTGLTGYEAAEEIIAVVRRHDLRAAERAARLPRNK